MSQKVYLRRPADGGQHKGGSIRVVDTNSGLAALHDAVEVVGQQLPQQSPELIALVESPQVCSLKFLTCEQRSV